MEKHTESDTGLTARPLQPLVRPAHVHDIGGCPPDCGHSEEEHIAFDMGVYDGERGTTIPPVQCCESTNHSRELREAWMTGYSIGVRNRPN